MSKRQRSGDEGPETADYRHTGETRKNIPPAKIAAEGTVPRVPKVKYHYSPHLPPVLRFDPSGGADHLLELVAQAGRRPLTPEEQHVLAEALRTHEPWLEWGGKREQHERGFFEVDPVALHIHERVSSQACVRAAMREDIQRSLFADPEQPYQQAVQFYSHDVDWANRLILGDSLQVMSSLARREGLAGAVQMIYMDPPYNVNFKSNFQSRVGQRDVTDKERDLTREPETIRAYRDTWNLGVHSYLTYMRERLIAARDLLADTGSIFLQINDKSLGILRNLGEEVFGTANFIVSILIKKKGSQKGTLIDPINDYVLWFAKDRASAKKHYKQLYEKFVFNLDFYTTFRLVELDNGEVLSLSELQRRDGVDSRMSPEELGQRYPGARFFTSENATAGGVRKNQSAPFEFEGRTFDPGLDRGNCWKHTVVSEGTPSGMSRLAQAGRLYVGDKQLRLRRYAGDTGVQALANWWDHLGGAPDPVYVVQTNPEIVKRCLLMTTEPGDLVLDPTCGGGTTALVAEQWGRRWITVDTSRVATAATRQRMLTSQFAYYVLLDEKAGPRGGFEYENIGYVSSSLVANCANLDPIFAKHEPILTTALTACNKALNTVAADTRRRLQEKLAGKLRAEGKRAVTDGDRRRWDLPKDKFEHWTVPFDTDPDWPKPLQDAVMAYRKVWRDKMDEVNACIEANAGHEELVDQPEVVKGVLRVSGPFTVEGVMPEELSLGEEGLFDGTPNEFEDDAVPAVEPRNLHAYLTRMAQALRADGVTFLGNKRRKFARLEPLFEQNTGSLVHAEGIWDDGDSAGPNTVAVGFGPQYGPVTAQQVEELIRASKRYDELVVAGFSFDAAASAAIQEAAHPKLRIHQAYIRPDINPGMDGLLKDTPNSQLFTVFGQPEVEVKKTRDGQYLCRLEGVDVYDPLTNTVRSTGAEKVAAWFLDQDYDGRCFCITQAFFPDQDAWKKIAKALGSSADPDAFEAFKGTQSLPFVAGKHRRIAVKVIDPRGNEVMAIRRLAD